MSEEQQRRRRCPSIAESDESSRPVKERLRLLSSTAANPKGARQIADEADLRALLDELNRRQFVRSAKRDGRDDPPAA